MGRSFYDTFARAAGHLWGTFAEKPAAFRAWEGPGRKGRGHSARSPLARALSAAAGGGAGPGGGATAGEAGLWRPRPAELFRAAGAERRRAALPGAGGGEPLPPLPPPLPPAGRRRRRRLGAMAALMLVLLAALGGRTVLPGGRCAAPLADLRSQISGVESLLEEFRRQLQQEEPGPPAAAAASGGGGGGERCGGSSSFSARPDSIIRTKDSIAAGATFLRAPAGVAGWRQCLDACCAEPRCTLAVVQGPGRPRGGAAAAELGCYLFNCTHRGRPVCRFAPHRGYSTYSRRPAGLAAPLGKGRRRPSGGGRGGRKGVAGPGPRWLRAGRAPRRARGAAAPRREGRWRQPALGAGAGRAGGRAPLAAICRPRGGAGEDGVGETLRAASTAPGTGARVLRHRPRSAASPGPPPSRSRREAAQPCPGVRGRCGVCELGKTGWVTAGGRERPVG